MTIVADTISSVDRKFRELVDRFYKHDNHSGGPNHTPHRRSGRHAGSRNVHDVTQLMIVDKITGAAELARQLGQSVEMVLTRDEWCGLQQLICSDAGCSEQCCESCDSRGFSYVACHALHHDMALKQWLQVVNRQGVREGQHCNLEYRGDVYFQVSPLPVALIRY